MTLALCLTGRSKADAYDWRYVATSSFDFAFPVGAYGHSSGWPTGRPFSLNRQPDLSPRRLTVLGATGITNEDFDFDPGSLVPDFVDPEDFSDEGLVKAESLARGPMPRYERAKEFLRQFSFHIAPGSLLAASEIQRKLLYLQLSRAGLIDVWTLLDVLGVPNAGLPPQGANTITERLAAQQQMNIAMAENSAGRKATGQSMPRLVTKES